MQFVDDSIFQASKLVSKMAIKNIKSVPVPTTSDDDSTQPTSSLLTMQNPNLSLNNGSVGKAYEDFSKMAHALNNELDEFLTDLDNQYKEVEYPHIDLTNKRNHNPEFDQYYNGAGFHKHSKKLHGGTLDGTNFQGVSTRNIIAACRNHNIANNRNRNLCINAIINAPRETQHLILNELGLIVEQSEDEDSDFDSDGDVSEMDSDDYHSEYSVVGDYGHYDESVADSASVSDFSQSVDDDSDTDSEDSANSQLVHPYQPLLVQVVDNDSDDDDDNYIKEIVTNHLKSVANQVSNMHVQFSNALQPNFKQLTQSKVTSVGDIFQQLKPKMEELLNDEFIHKFHITQVRALTTNFDKLYTMVIIATKSFVKNTSDGGYLQQRRHNHINERYHL